MISKTRAKRNCGLEQGLREEMRVVWLDVPWALNLSSSIRSHVPLVSILGRMSENETKFQYRC
jgi:hypothetical protein